jgi:hypothetical protein
MEGLFDKLKGKEDEKKVERIVTLVGTKLTKEGDEFVFLGESKKCEGCKLKNSCMNLEVGRRYRIEKVRDEIKHDCFIHEDGVCVVEVVEPPIKATIEARKALKGSKIVFEPIDCEEKNCEVFDFCHPLGLKEGDRCTICEVIGNASGDCKKVFSLKLVELKR